MKAFRALAVVAAIAVYGQVVLGGVVRITGSGLGCPDWPACQGHIIPDFANSHVVIEYAHRLVGSAAGLLMLAVALYALAVYTRQRSSAMPRGLMLAAVAGVGLIVVQGILGGITVLMGNSPFTVAIHLGNALLVLGSAVLVALWATRALHAGLAAEQAPATSTPSRALYAGLGAAFLIVVSGAYVVGSGASAACPGWPACGAASGSAGSDIHFLHRVVVLGAAIAVLRAVLYARKRWRGAPLALVAYLVVVAFGLEVAVGAVQVLTGLPQALRASHLAIATLVWAGSVMLAGAYWLETRPEAARALAPSRPRQSEAAAG